MHTATLKGSVISSCPPCVLWWHIPEGERSDHLWRDKRSSVALLSPLHCSKWWTAWACWRRDCYLFCVMGWDLGARLLKWGKSPGFRFVICPYRWSLIASVKEMTRRGRGHAKWDFCMYRSSPIKLILPGVIQQTVQSHSCHHNIVIWTVEMANVLNSILVQTSCSLLCIMIFVWTNGSHCSDNEDIAKCGVEVCLNCAVLAALCAARWSNNSTMERPWRWKYLSEGDWVESHWLLRGLLAGHFHKYRTISSR